MYNVQYRSKKLKYLRYGSVAVCSRFASGALKVRSRYAQGSLLVRSGYAVRFGAVRYFVRGAHVYAHLA